MASLREDPCGQKSNNKSEVRTAMSATDAIADVIRAAVADGVREALNISEMTNRRLLSIEDAAVYTNSSKREVQNMISRGELPAVHHGRRTKIDIRDLDRWIETAKV